MFGPRSSKNPIYWFIPALLAGVLVLSGLCLFLIRAQARGEEARLRSQERLTLDQAQRQFRTRIETDSARAFQQVPTDKGDHSRLRNWDQQLGESMIGFCLDDSGILVYPKFHIFPGAVPVVNDVRQILSAPFSEDREFSRQDARDQLQVSERDNNHRQMLAAVEKKQQETGLSLAQRILSNISGRTASDGILPELSASVVLLELEEMNERTVAKQAAVVDAWLRVFEDGLLPLSVTFLPWMKRMQEQCRRRNETESWLLREKRLWHQVRQIEWAEKFVPRLNLLLRRHLYNPERSELPVQVLSSDPAEEPFLVLCRFQNVSALTLAGVAVDLQSYCRWFETAIDKAPWRPADVLVRIWRQGSFTADRQPASAFASNEDSNRVQGPSLPLSEQRILDPWAPQFVIAAQPHDFEAFERRAVQKNLLYLTLVILTIATCVLVLFFGNRALREQQQLSKLRSDFLTSVSHELRTPLTAIRLHAETLERQLSSGSLAARSSLETIVGEVDRLGLLINDVLEFTRLENAAKRYRWESVDLVAVIQSSLQLFSQQLAELGFEVKLDLPESLVLEKADSAALKQCAVNLISNSVKFSPKEKFLAIRLRDNANLAIWEIEDRGMGIDPADRAHVFERFFRGSHLDPAISGTGLGLTLCKAFVEAHGGTIACGPTASGAGALFSIRLPMNGRI